jgi:molybdate transport system substrate-binding protein
MVAMLAALGAAARAHGGEITVSAASSLGNAFREVVRAYEAAHPGRTVALNVGASGALLQQLAKGAPVDVLAVADQETMDAAQKQGLVRAADRHDFARNRLVVVVPGDRRIAPRTLADLAQPGIARIALGQPASVPAGRYARHALDAARLWPAVGPKTIGTRNVRQALDYVARGEVDAGFVYATDAALMPGKVKTAFEVALDAPVTYPIAVVRGTSASMEAARNAEARAFADYVLSAPAQAVLARYGFTKP